MGANPRGVTYLASFNELNSRVQLSGQSLKRVRTAAVTPEMYWNIWRKYGTISDSNADLLHAVREAGIEEEELARALSTKKQIARPQKEKERKLLLKGNRSRKPPRPRKRKGALLSPQGERAPTKTTNFLSKKSCRNPSRRQ